MSGVRSTCLRGASVGARDDRDHRLQHVARPLLRQPGGDRAELRRRGAGLREVWIADERVVLPEGAERIEPGSPEERFELERARWIVSNDVLPLDFAKAHDTTYLQTWHGTPLKRIAFDVTNPTFPDADYHYAVELGREVAKWDVLLSPNSFSTERLRRAFRFERPILETGYPRNDVCWHPIETRSARTSAPRSGSRATPGRSCTRRRGATRST
jgi:CDP-glycerol glycerophosphotransferase